MEQKKPGTVPHSGEGSERPPTGGKKKRVTSAAALAALLAMGSPEERAPLPVQHANEGGVHANEGGVLVITPSQMAEEEERHPELTVLLTSVGAIKQWVERARQREDGGRWGAWLTKEGVVRPEVQEAWEQYVAAFSNYPTPAQLAAFIAHLARGGAPETFHPETVGLKGASLLEEGGGSESGGDTARTIRSFYEQRRAPIGNVPPANTGDVGRRRIIEEWLESMRQRSKTAEEDPSWGYILFTWEDVLVAFEEELLRVPEPQREAIERALRDAWERARALARSQGSPVTKGLVARLLQEGMAAEQ